MALLILKMADLFETSDSDSEDEAAAAMEPVLSLSNPRNDAGFRPRSQTENSMHRQEEMNPRSTNALSSSSKGKSKLYARWLLPWT